MSKIKGLLLLSLYWKSTNSSVHEYLHHRQTMNMFAHKTTLFHSKNTLSSKHSIVAFNVCEAYTVTSLIIKVHKLLFGKCV